MLLLERQAEMRAIATGLTPPGDMEPKEALRRIKRLIKMEQASADGSQATIDRSEHDHVKKSGRAALNNRRQTIKLLEEAVTAIREDRDLFKAMQLMTEASNCGGKKSVKAARKAPTVALFVEYLAETDAGFRQWLAEQGIKA